MTLVKAHYLEEPDPEDFECPLDDCQPDPEIQAVVQSSLGLSLEHTAPAAATPLHEVITQDPQSDELTASKTADLTSDFEPDLPFEVEQQVEIRSDNLQDLCARSSTKAADPAPLPDEPLKVRSRVFWDNCPAHCASWNPFTIIGIEDGMAWLDIYEQPVPKSYLRRAT